MAAVFSMRNTLWKQPLFHEGNLHLSRKPRLEYYTCTTGQLRMRYIL